MLSPRGTFDNVSLDFLVVKPQELLLESSGQRPGMPLNILQFIGQPPQQRVIWSPLSVMPRLGSSTLEQWEPLTEGAARSEFCFLTFTLDIESRADCIGGSTN